MQQGWVPAQTPWQLAQYYQMLSQQQPQQPKANPMRDLVSKGVNEGVNKLASDYLPSIFGDAGSVMPSTEALPWTQGFGSDMIGAQAAPGAFDLAGIGSAGNAFLPLAGAAGAYDTLTHDRGIASGALRGAASGAAIGSFFPGPGTAVGAGIGALIGGGASIVNGMGDKDAYKTEWKRKKDLYDKGIISAQQLGQEPTRGRTDAELIQRAQQSGGNVAFAKSRNESDLTPADIQGYSSIIEEANRTGKSRMQLAQEALDAGAVREHHGTVDVDWSKVGAGNTIPKAPAVNPAVASLPQGTLKSQAQSFPTSPLKPRWGVVNPITGRR